MSPTPDVTASSPRTSEQCPITHAFPTRRDPASPLDPPPEITEHGRLEPVTRVRQWDGIEAWLVTGYDEARAVLSDPRFSVDPRQPGFPEKNAAYSVVMGRDRNLRTMDPPEHTVQRRMVGQDFSPRSVNETRPTIERYANQLIDKMLAAGPPVDLYSQLALELTTMVICDVLGVPSEDRAYFAEKSVLCTASEISPEVAAEGGAALNEYIDRLLDVKMTQPADDVASRLLHEQTVPGHLSRKDTVELIRFILIAGHETTAHTIALSVLALLQNPDQLDDLRADPALIPNAADELLRYTSVAHLGRRRVAVDDVVLGDKLIRAGDGVIVANHIADRDEGRFPNANRLDLRRPNARAALVFGFGLHQCLGQTLSRVELQVVLGTLWNRIPSLALAVPFSELEFVEDHVVYGMRQLPVTWSKADSHV